MLETLASSPDNTVKGEGVSKGCGNIREDACLIIPPTAELSNIYAIDQYMCVYRLLSML